MSIKLTSIKNINFQLYSVGIFKIQAKDKLQPAGQQCTDLDMNYFYINTCIFNKMRKINGHSKEYLFFKTLQCGGDKRHNPFSDLSCP
jgi:hypothetical protein